MDLETIKREILSLVALRGKGTICPSEVARKLGGEDWRDLMEPVRSVGIELEESGRIDILQKGVKVRGTIARGPIRYRMRQLDDS